MIIKPLADDIQLHWIRNPKEATEWRAGFIGAYQTVFAEPPYNERYTPIDAEGIYQKLTSISGNITLIAAKKNRAVVGFGIAIPIKDKYSVSSELSGLIPLPHTMYLAELGVLEEYRRMGIGRTLIRERMRLIDRNNFTHVVLRVSTNVDPTKKLYESLGFEDMGVYMEVSRVRNNGLVKTDRRQFMSHLLSLVPIEKLDKNDS
jgi:ribosomal protein S18 acetylase RimI-like enzyme